MSKDETSRYEADALADLMQERQALNWLVEGWLEQGTLAVLVGPEGSFKSFLAIDWTMSIATGSKWQGCRVVPGGILYIAAEARTGVIRRMQGWADYYEIIPDDVFLGRRAVELVMASDVDRLQSFLEGKQWALIVIDTLARNFGAGNENEAQTMSAAIANADRIRERTGATVLLVHHTPLEGREEGKLRPRGSSALAGAADTIVTCIYDKASKVVTVSSTKQKDAPSPETCFLTYEVVDLGDKDNFGNPITTVVLRPTHLRPVSKKALGKNQKILLQTLRSMMNGSDGDILVTTLELMERLSTAIPTKQRRADVMRWLREQEWARPAVGGHFIDVQRIPHG